jgi:hypothetical protein
MNRIVRVCTAAVAATLLVVLAGCTPTENAATTIISSGESHEAPQSVPDPAETSAPVAAARPPGSCEELLDMAGLATDLGGGKDNDVKAGGPLIAAVGGIDCTYYFRDPTSADNDDEDDFSPPAGSGWVELTAAPKDIANARERDASLVGMDCATDSQNTGLWSGGCSETATVGGWWYRLDVHTVTPLAKLRASSSAVDARVKAALTDAPAPAPARFVAPFDCSSVDTGGIPVATFGRDAPGESEIYAAAALLAGPVTCTFIVNKAEWSLTVYPGGANAYEQCTRASWANDVPGAPLTVPGVKAVFAFADDGNDYSPEACATDGVSLIHVSREWQTEGRDSFQSPASVAKLQSLLVPTFAAISPSSVPLSTVWDPPASTGTVAVLAGGDCKKLLDPTPAATNLGTANERHIGSGDPAFATIGGLDCSYATGGFNEGTGGQIYLTVVPRSIAHPDQIAATLNPADCISGTDGGNSGCHTIAIAGDWWYELRVYGAKSEKKQKAAYLTLKAQLDVTLKAIPAPDSIGVNTPFDCTAVTAGGLDFSGSRHMDRSNAGGPISGAALLLAGPSVCTFDLKKDDTWEATVYPGSTAAYDQCTRNTWMGGKNGKILSVPGVSSAFALEAIDSGALMCASDGTSSVELLSFNSRTWSASLRKKLGALLVPIFAAAK